MPLLHRLLHTLAVFAWTAYGLSKGAFSHAGKEWVLDRTPGVLLVVTGLSLAALWPLRRFSPKLPVGELALFAVALSVAAFGLIVAVLLVLHQNCC